MAANNGALDTVRFLIGAGADVNMRDSADETPLMRVLLGGHARLDTVKALVEAKADVNARNKSGTTVLEMLTWSNDVGSLKIGNVLTSAGVKTNCGYWVWRLGMRLGHPMEM